MRIAATCMVRWRQDTGVNRLCWRVEAIMSKTVSDSSQGRNSHSMKNKKEKKYCSIGTQTDCYAKSDRNVETTVAPDSSFLFTLWIWHVIVFSFNSHLVIRKPLVLYLVSNYRLRLTSSLRIWCCFSVSSQRISGFDRQHTCHGLETFASYPIIKFS